MIKIEITCDVCGKTIGDETVKYNRLVIGGGYSTYSVDIIDKFDVIYRNSIVCNACWKIIEDFIVTMKIV